MFASLFTLGVAAAKALAILNKLGCWLSKQTNTTSQALSDLLLDVDPVCHTALQNRAAIDFLLLTQGPGCEDTEGLCCMNVLEHSTSIHQSIQQLQEGVQKLRVGTSWGWFYVWFQCLGPWIQKLIKSGLMCLLIFVCLLSVFLALYPM